MKIPLLRKKSFRFPRIITYTHVLVVLVLLFSFALGYLFNQVRYLEKAVAAAKVAGAQAAPSGIPNQPVPSGPPQKVNVSIGHLPVKGDDKAKVTLIEF